MQTLTAPIAGRLDELIIGSEALRDNPLGDPHERPLWVYVPPGYDEQPAERYPSVYVIQGYTGQLEMWANRMPFVTPFPQAADAVFAAGAPPCIVVYVDAWTSYGGSQFVDSPGTGNYHSYLCDDVVPFVDQHYRTIDAPASRAITGKSSGGFGAMITPMLRPDLFGALATHAGDALYELCYIPEFGPVVRALRRFDGDPHRWWTDFQSRAATGSTTPADQVILDVYGVAACFSADPDGTPVLPFDPVAGVLREDAWARWLALDPVRMVGEHAASLRDLTAIWIDAGNADDFQLDIGAQAFRAALEQAGVPDERIHFELFDGTHAGIAYRYPMALAWLADRLAR